MSFSVVFDNYKRTEEHIKEPRPEAPYRFVETHSKEQTPFF